MNGKLKPKLIALFIAFIIAVFLSMIGSWIILQIFTKHPEEILNFTFFKIISIFEIEEGIQIFILFLISFSLLIIFSVYKLCNLDDYLSKTYKVTKEIRIPNPVRKRSNATRFFLVVRKEGILKNIWCKYF